MVQGTIDVRRLGYTDKYERQVARFQCSFPTTCELSPFHPMLTLYLLPYFLIVCPQMEISDVSNWFGVLILSRITKTFHQFYVLTVFLKTSFDVASKPANQFYSNLIDISVFNISMASSIKSKRWFRKIWTEKLEKWWIAKTSVTKKIWSI